MGKQRKRRSENSSKGQAFAQTCLNNMRLDNDKKQQNRRRMRVVQLQRLVDRKLQDLRAFPKTPPSPTASARKGPTSPSKWKLKGAARPAALLARIAAGELDECGNEYPKPVETFDLYEKALRDGDLAQHKDIVEYISLLKQLAVACCEAGMPDRGIKSYELCMTLDKNDTIRSCEGLVCVLIDEGRGVDARALIEKHMDEKSAVLAYCEVIIEYVSWEVLEEEGSSEAAVQKALRKAYELNPFIAVVIAYHDTFLQVVEYVDEIKNPKRGSIEEAFRYVLKNIGVWVDTVGACHWIEKELDVFTEIIPTKEDVSDEMYLGMYETAVDMHKELLAGAQADVAGANDEGDSEDDFNPEEI